MKSRLFKFGVSPLVYSRSFVALPERARVQIWKRIDAVLNSTTEFTSLTTGEKATVREILLATKHDFAEATR
jgi:hypothetical protein